MLEPYASCVSHGSNCGEKHLLAPLRWHYCEVNALAMDNNSKNYFANTWHFIARRFRELIFIISSFPVLLILFIAVTTALSTGLFIPFAVIIILGLLAAMEIMASFEIGRTNLLLKTAIQPSQKTWFNSKFFSWEGAKERAISARSWLAIGYVFLAFGLSILGLVVSALALGSILCLLATLGFLAFHPSSGTFNIHQNDFTGNMVVNLDSNNLQIHFLGFDIQDGPINGNVTWTYTSPLFTLLSILFIVVAVAMVPLIAKWQRQLVVRFLSDRSFAEIFYSSERRRKTAVSVGTQDRSRIERDLHDGVQARLTVSGIEIDRARQMAEKSEDKELSEALDRAASETSQAMQEIRNLVKGLRPALLEKAGLAAALNSLGSKQEFQVVIEADIERLNSDTESAIYLICSEAMTNVARHSKAKAMSISLRKRGLLLTLDIEDDGIGGAQESDGTGLRNMKDRADALGGEFILISPVGGPTRIKVIVPCE
jgi:signal transduction histidine kinase